jgi:spore germination protein KA
LWGKYEKLSVLEKRGTLMKADRSLDINEKSLQGMLFHSSDFKTSDFMASERHYRLFYLDTMIELPIVQDHIIRPLLRNTDMSVREAVSILDYSETDLLLVASQALVEGKTVVQIEGEAKLYLLGTELNKERAVNIPVNERVLRGYESQSDAKADLDNRFCCKVLSAWPKVEYKSCRTLPKFSSERRCLKGV